MAAHAKIKGVLLGHHNQALNTPRAIRTEMVRLYRAAVSGKLPLEELSRLIYALTQINNAIAVEQDAMPTIDQVETFTPLTVNIVGVAEGVFVPRDPELTRLHQSSNDAPPMLKVFSGDEVDEAS